jgi:hypothetical protein
MIGQAAVAGEAPQGGLVERAAEAGCVKGKPRKRGAAHP